MKSNEPKGSEKTLLISAVTESLFADRIEALVRSQDLEARNLICVVPQIYKREYRHLGSVVPLPAARYGADLVLPELVGFEFETVMVLFENNIFRFQNVIEFARRTSAKEVSVFDLASGRRCSPSDSLLTRARFQLSNTWAARRENGPAMLLKLLRLFMPAVVKARQRLHRPIVPAEAMACPLCASIRTTEKYAFDEKYRIHVCGECSFNFQIPHPSAEELASHFTAYGIYPEPEFSANAYRNAPAPRYRAIRDAAATTADLKVLEIGCGNGSYLYNLKQRYPQMEVVGQEIDPVNGRFARENSKCEVWIGNIAELELPVDYFDFVVATQVIEHIPIRELMRVVPAICKTLKAGGKFIGDLPNFDSLPHTWLGKRWKNVSPVDHNSMLTSKSLAKLFCEYGGFSHYEIDTSGTVNVAQIALNFWGIRDPKFEGMSRWHCRVGPEEGADLVFSAVR